MSHSLEIDCDLAIEIFVDHLTELVARDRSDGLLLGLSGGLDSSVLTALAVKALGAGRVRVAYLYDRESDAEIADNARLLADWAGLTLDVRDITREMHEQQIYDPLFVRLLSYSGRLNRLFQRSYSAICGETPFKTTLRVGAGERISPIYKRTLFNNSMRHVDRGFTARHVCRRRILEEQAKREGLTLIGAANRSEFEVGWFVKGGVDDP